MFEGSTLMADLVSLLEQTAPYIAGSTCDQDETN